MKSPRRRSAALARPAHHRATLDNAPRCSATRTHATSSGPANARRLSYAASGYVPKEGPKAVPQECTSALSKRDDASRIVWWMHCMHHATPATVHACCNTCHPACTLQHLPSCRCCIMTAAPQFHALATRARKEAAAHDYLELWDLFSLNPKLCPAWGCLVLLCTEWQSRARVSTPTPGRTIIAAAASASSPVINAAAAAPPQLCPCTRDTHSPRPRTRTQLLTTGTAIPGAAPAVLRPLVAQAAHLWTHFWTHLWTGTCTLQHSADLPDAPQPCDHRLQSRHADGHAPLQVSDAARVTAAQATAARATKRPAVLAAGCVGSCNCRCDRLPLPVAR
eukprot:356630-Chlamydomonas_euryale.AAC.7